MPSDAPQAAGFTMTELLIVIAIAAVLTTVAVPSFRAMIVNGNRREASTGLYSAFIRARSEAIARNAQVTVCPRSGTTCGGTDWDQGWLVHYGTAATPGTIVQAHEPVSALLNFTPSSALTFLPSGRLSGTASQSIQLCSAPPTTDKTGRVINVPLGGGATLQEFNAC